MRIRLHRLGRHQGAHDIEPSCGVMDILDGSSVQYRIVTDCGLIPKHTFGPDEARWRVPDAAFFEDGVPINAVRITHAHGDHVGYLPALVKFLAKDARVFATRPTAAMLERVLRDAIEINERKLVDPPFSRMEMNNLLGRLTVIEKPGEMEIFPGIRDYIHPAGHINGACSFTTQVGGMNVHYAGDRCEHDQPGIRGATSLPAEWCPDIIACSDCTYGADLDSDGRNWDDEMARGFDECRAALLRNAQVLVFAFAIHHGGAIAHELARRGLVYNGKMFLDGACRYFTKLMDSSAGQWCDSDEKLDLTYIRMMQKHDRDFILNKLRRYTVVATPGMGGPGGIGSMYREHILPNPEALVVFSGYVAPGSDGDMMLRAARERDVAGLAEKLVQFKVELPDGTTELRDIPIRARVIQIRTGSHSSRGETLRWFRDIAPKAAVLTHGSPSALASLEQELHADIPRLVRADTEPSVEIDL